jgi:flagellar protein FlaG
MEITNNVARPAPGVVDAAVKGGGQSPAVDGEMGGKKLPQITFKAIGALEGNAAPVVPEFEPKDIGKAIKELQAYVDGLGRNLNFRMDSSLDRTIVSVRDKNTNELVRQIPGDEVIAMSRQIQSLLDSSDGTGFLYDNQI